MPCARSHPHDDPCPEHDALTRLARAENRVARLEAALEQRIVSFSGDRILCLDCGASDTGTVQTMEITHAKNCPIAGTITRHPSRR